MSHITTFSKVPVSKLRNSSPDQVSSEPVRTADLRPHRRRERSMEHPLSSPSVCVLELEMKVKQNRRLPTVSGREIGAPKQRS